MLNLKAIDPKVMKIVSMRISDLCKVKPGDHVMIVADTDTDPGMITAFVNAVSQAGAIFTVCVQPVAGWDPEDPYALTRPLKAAYIASDLVIAATKASGAAVYGRPADFREEMRKTKRVRLLSLIERDFETVVNDTADYSIVTKTAEKIQDVLTKGKRVHITSQAGTDLWADTCPESMHHESNQPGFWFVALPDGETHYGPVYTTVEGKAVIDGPIANVVTDGKPDQPVEIEIHKGRIVNIEGGSDAKKLKEYLAKIKGDYISEIGFGTHPDAPKPRRMHDFKKPLGNFHIAYGGWWGVQDRESIIRDRGADRADEAIPCMIHGDMVILMPAKLEVDGKTIIDNGKLLV